MSLFLLLVTYNIYEITIVKDFLYCVLVCNKIDIFQTVNIRLNYILFEQKIIILLLYITDIVCT